MSMKPRTRVDSHDVLKRFREEYVECPGGDGMDGLEGSRLREMIDAAVRPDHEVQAHLEALCKVVGEHLWIGKCCMVDWLTKDLWAMVEERGWASELESLTNEEIALLSQCSLEREWRTPALGSFYAHCKRLRLSAQPLPFLDTRTKAPLIAMSQKKEHEVRVMSQVCAGLAKEAGASCVVDIGSGKGYLTTAIASGYSLKAVGIDSLQGNTAGALKRHALVSRVTPQAAADGAAKHLSAGGSGGEFMAVTGYVRMEGGGADEFVRYLGEKTGGKVQEGDVLLMAGLHTCGDLAPTMIRSFAEWSTVKCFCGVGCCYNLLTQECDDEKFDMFGASEEDIEKRGRNPGFPLTETVKASGIHLNRNCRNLAAHNHKPVCSEEEMSSEERSIAYRAALQKLWVEKMVQYGAPELQAGNVSVGKIAGKCPTLVSYIRRAQEKLGVPKDIVTDEEIEALWGVCESGARRMRLMTSLRALIAQVIESLILLDRVLFLQTRPEIKTACLLPLFDPFVSPSTELFTP